MNSNSALNSTLDRRSMIFGTALSMIGALNASDDQTRSDYSLKSKFQSKALIGVALPNNFLETFSPKELSLIETHFNSITPENCMKWPELAREQGVYRFTQADKMVEYARHKNLSIVGHTLIFNRDNCYPKWLFKDINSKADTNKAWDRIETHISTIMGRYKGKIDSWDVLNEFVEVHEPGYRPTEFTKILGEDYPIRLFKLVEQIDPKVKLTYNDFGVEQPERREKIFNFIRKLKNAGCKIDVLGSQSHLELHHNIGENLNHTIQKFASIGVKCAFTELDVDVIPRSQYWNLSAREEVMKSDPYAKSCPDDILEQQASVYQQVFQAVLSNSQSVDRVTLWGLTDKHSWLNKWPWKRTNHGLLFNREGQAKPALNKILSL